MKLQTKAPAVTAALPATVPAATAPARQLSVHPKKLGSGAYGSVQLGTISDAEGAVQSVAVKMISADRMRSESLAREASILERLSRVDHPSTVRFHGWFKPGARGVGTDDAELRRSLGSSHCFVMDRLQGGELFEYVLERKGLSEDEAAPLLLQMVSGVHNAHMLGIAHRDLKLENALFAGKPGPSGVVKLIDWGLAHQHEVRLDGSVVRELVHSRCGSRSYMAPEVVVAKEKNGRRGPGYDAFSADVWSLGVCMFAMLFGFFPFDQADPLADWRARKCVEAQLAGGSLIDTIFGFYPKKKLRISAGAKALLDSMLTFDASKRATLEQVLTSRWLAPMGSLPTQQHSQSAVELAGPTGYTSGTASARTSSLLSEPASGSASRSSDSQLPNGPETWALSNVRLKGFAAKASDEVSVSSAGSSVRRSVARLEALEARVKRAEQQRACLKAGGLLV